MVGLHLSCALGFGMMVCWGVLAVEVVIRYPYRVLRMMPADAMLEGLELTYRIYRRNGRP